MLGKIVGHNIHGFDLPYLLRSTAIHGAEAHTALLPRNRGYWPDNWFDTMKYWTAGNYKEYISLNNLASTLGCNFTKDESGKDFYTFPRAKQEQYLENDLQLTDFIFTRFNEAFNICDDYLIIDIETAPLSEEALDDLIPKFDRSSCKAPSTWKDEEKIKNYINNKELEHRSKFIDKAGLDPRYSVPVAIGYKWSHGDIAMDFGQPKALLDTFWQRTGKFWQGEMEKHNEIKQTISG
jgi:hypothetical protein